MMVKNVKKINQQLYELSKVSRKFIEKNNVPINTENKSDIDFVTSTDISLQKIARKWIRNIDPKTLIISEEEYSKQDFQNDIFWLIDPLDGTSNYISSIPFTSLAISLFKNNQVIFGAVLDLNRNEIFSAYKNQGAFHNGLIIRSKVSKSNLIGISSGLINSNNLDKHLYFDGYKYRILGSQALHLCYVASGRFAGCINKEAKIWDDSAGSLILNESGSYYHSPLIDKLGNWDLSSPDIDLNSIGIHHEDKQLYNLITKR